MIDTSILAFTGAFLGALLAHLMQPYIIAPLLNRSEHKRLMEKSEFRAQWGRNPISFFLKYGGIRRG